MVEVECPLCTRKVDLGSDTNGTYECPYCQEDFDWNGKDKLQGRWRQSSIAQAERKSNDFLNALENRNTEKNFKFPLLVGNFKARWKRPTLDFTLFVLFLVIFVHPYSVLLFVLVIPIKILYKGFKRLKYSKEFAENKLNPEYLRGTGLEIRSNLNAVLITRWKVPRYVFEKKEITKIVLHKETWSEYGRAPVYELYVHLHRVHALTIYGFNKSDSEDIVSTLMSLYDIEFQYTEVHHSGGGTSN